MSTTLYSHCLVDHVIYSLYDYKRLSLTHTYTYTRLEFIKSSLFLFTILLYNNNMYIPAALTANTAETTTI